MIYISINYQWLLEQFFTTDWKWLKELVSCFFFITQSLSTTSVMYMATTVNNPHTFLKGALVNSYQYAFCQI